MRSVLDSQQAVDDFKSRARAAAHAWADKSGVQISEAPPGQAGNISISASSSQAIRDAIGQVRHDKDDPNRRTLTISDDYNSFSPEGRDYLFAHEFGHIIGLDDVFPDECQGVNTIMRETYTGQQLVNGNSGTQPGLPGPSTPTDCDENKARAEQQPYIADNSGDGSGSIGVVNSGYYSNARYCTTYWRVWYVSWDGGVTWEESGQVDYVGCW